MKTYILGVLLLVSGYTLMAQNDGHDNDQGGQDQDTYDQESLEHEGHDMGKMQHPKGPHIMGQVFAVNDYGEPEPFPKARVYWLDQTAGTLSDSGGVFHLEYKTKKPKFPKKLVVAATGFENDTLEVTQHGWLEITLSPYALTKIAIKTSRNGTYIDRLNPIQTEVVGQGELTAAACCNLSESFTNNASVDAVHADAVTGTREVRLLGLAGVNTQILTNNLPMIRGLGRTHGLDYMPSNWVKSLAVSKGVGSVRNGYESIAGQINLAKRLPDDNERLYADLYGNVNGRMEANATVNIPLKKERLYTQLQVHGAMFNSPPDQNDDGFYDAPIHRDAFVSNNWMIKRDDNTTTDFGITGIWDERFGGSTQFDFDDSPQSQPNLYGFDWGTRRVTGYVKSGHRLAKPHQTMAVQATGLYHDQTGAFGSRDYTSRQTQGWLNVIYSSHIGGEENKFLAGASVLYDDIEEQYDTSGYARQEIVPGAFFEHTWDPSRTITMVSGMRVDYHNLYGLFYSPRWHTQFNLTDNTTLRVAGGRGYRVPTPFIENIGQMVTNRQVMLTDDIQPEVAWNAGGSFVQIADWGNSLWTFSADYYFTWYDNQLIVDRDARQDRLAFYNLDGQSYAHSAQAGIEVKPVEWLTLKTAYKFRDVRQTIAEELRLKPLMAQHIWHSVFNIERDKWGLNLMLHYVGEQRLPDSGVVPEDVSLGNASPNYWLLNANVKYKWRWFEFYAGVDNALNTQVDRPIRSSDDPTTPWFDAAYAWGPVIGMTPYAGVRITVESGVR